MMYEIELIKTFDAAHRVVGHEGGRGKCARLHGHTYRVVVSVKSDYLTMEGFVVDFAKIKEVLDEWDHQTILWDRDPLLIIEAEGAESLGLMMLSNVDSDHVVRVPFNPTSENMSRYLAEHLLSLEEGISEVFVQLSETPSSSAQWTAVR